MIKKFNFKNFSLFIHNQQKLVSINSLNKFLYQNFEKLTKDDYISVLNRFQELESNESNAKMKLYDVLDYIISDERKASDDVLLKTVMRVMLSVQMYDKIYWDHLQKILIRNNFLFISVYNYMEYLKIFSIVNYENEELWIIFEEYFLESNKSLELEDVQSVALCFGNNKKGTSRFWTTMFETFELKNQNSPDFIINFSICLCGFLQSKVINSIDIKMIEYFCKYLNFSINFLEKIIHEASIQKADMVYSLYHNFHKSYYIDEIHNQFPNYIEQNILKNFIDRLENHLSVYLEKNLNKLEEEDYEQISKILKYSCDHSILLNILKPKDFVKIFIDYFENFKNYEDIFNFLIYFDMMKIKDESLQKILDEQIIWEKFIEVMHLMNLDQLINLSQILKNFEVRYFRIWIFIQNFLRNHIQFIQEQSSRDLTIGEESVTKIQVILKIFNDPIFKSKEFVLLPFIVLVENSLEKIKIINSHNKQSNLNNAQIKH